MAVLFGIDSDGRLVIHLTNGKAQFTPVAFAAGRRLAKRLFNNKLDEDLDYSTIATVVLSRPVIGTMGLVEKEAVEQYGEDDITVYTSPR